MVQVNVTLTVPAESLSLPLASDPSLSVAVKPPVAHWGPGPVNVRLISHVLRQGQVCVLYQKERKSSQLCTSKTSGNNPPTHTHI